MEFIIGLLFIIVLIMSVMAISNSAQGLVDNIIGSLSKEISDKNDILVYETNLWEHYYAALRLYNVYKHKKELKDMYLKDIENIIMEMESIGIDTTSLWKKYQLLYGKC